MKKTLYLDMDGVLVDFMSGADKLSPSERSRFDGRLDKAPGIFGLMDPMPGAVEAFKELSKLFDVYILSTPPWGNASGWSDKYEWVEKHLGEAAHKRLILTHRKDLNRGDYLVDDRNANGADRFDGELVRFGSDRFPDWASVVDYLTRTIAVKFFDPGGSWTSKQVIFARERERAEKAIKYRVMPDTLCPVSRESYTPTLADATEWANTSEGFSFVADLLGLSLLDDGDRYVAGKVDQVENAFERILGDD